MGDLRNKANKERRLLEHEAWLAKHFPPKPLAAPIRCPGCDRTMYETKVYALPRGHWDQQLYSCADCMPEEIKAELGL